MTAAVDQMILMLRFFLAWYLPAKQDANIRPLIAQSKDRISDGFSKFLGYMY
jgi:hypothetical protein